MNVRRLTPAHADAYRAIMLEAYASAPEAFTATVAERAAMPAEWWAARVSDLPDPTERVLGAFANERLVGVTGLRLERRERARHKATLFGIYVRPALRNRGVARALIEAALDHARSIPGLRVVQLTATDTNAGALRLYASCGFVPFGTEPLAIRVGAGFVGKVHLWRELDADGA